MFATVFYYLSSPLNIIVLLVSSEKLPNAITMIIIIKIALSGLTMYIYLTEKYRNGKKIVLIFLSSCFALMAYNINFYFNLMWLDVVYMAPLVLTGLDRLIDKKGILMYAITLFIAILANFYIAYMLCIFLVIYFIEQLWIKYNFKKIRKQIENFIIVSLLIGSICAVFLIPTGIEIFNNTEKSAQITKSKFDFDISSLIMKTYIGTNSNSQSSNSIYYNCYIGVIILPLLYFYFINKNITIKKKIASSIIIFILIFPYFINSYNQIWHGFCSPIGFHYRQAFLLSLYLITLAYESYEKLDNIKWWNYVIYIIVYVGAAIFTALQDYDMCSNGKIALSIAFTIIEIILIKLRNKEYMEYLIFFIVTVELIFNCFLSLSVFDFQTRNNYMEYSCNLKEQLEDYLYKDYRFEKDMHITLNDTLLLNYKGTSSFNSLINKNTKKFLKKIGNYSSQNTIIYGLQNIITDSLLGIKTSISGFDYKYYNLIGTIEKNIDTDAKIKKTYNYKVYENPYALKIGCLINKKQEEFKPKSKNYIYYTEELLNYLTDTNEKCFIEYEIEESNTDCIIRLNSEEVTYFATYNDEKILIYEDNIRKYNVENDLALYNKAENVLTIKNKSKNKFVCGYYDIQKVKDKLNELRKNELEIVENTGSYIKGKINVPEENLTLFTTIPYEENWNIYVDGEKVEYYKMADTFIAVDLGKGEHEIELKYRVKGIKLGAIISIAGIITFFIYYNFAEKKKNSVEFKNSSINNGTTNK